MSNKTPKVSAKKTKWAPKDWLLVASSLLLVMASALLIKQKHSSGTAIFPGYRLCLAASTSIRPSCAGGGVRFERAVTSEQRIMGLSGRDSLAQDAAMLFIFDEPSRQCMWMKDMKFNLDILWLDKDRKIIRVEENVSPDTYPETFCAEGTKYVIELNAGVFRSAELELGDRMQL